MVIFDPRHFEICIYSVLLYKLTLHPKHSCKVIYKKFRATEKHLFLVSKYGKDPCEK